MKTDFLILWVDDQRHVIDALVMDLEAWLDNKGFELKTLIHADSNGVIDDIRNNDIELIIIDYRLRGKNGDEIIQEIRQNDFYQDIIFYSEGGPPDIKFDGVHYVSKEDAKSRIKELTDLKLRRSSDFATLRGWIVADAIELEMMLDKILLQCFAPNGELFESQILGRSGILDFFKKQQIVNSILSNELKQLGEAKDTSERRKKLEECKGVFRSFTDDVIHYRNAVAHGKYEVTTNGVRRVKTLIKSPEYFNFDQESLASGRKNLRRQRDCLDMLSQYISPRD